MIESRTPLPEIAAISDEHTMLQQFLEYFRTVMLRKVEGLDDQQARVTVAASSIDMLGMVRHLADVERWWFRAVFTQEVTDAIYEADDDVDADWHHAPTDTLVEAMQHWHNEVAWARQIVAANTDVNAIASLVTERRGQISLRWIMVHMIEEYARHCGHADLIREAIDGTVAD